jgi:hypothetical protein
MNSDNKNNKFIEIGSKDHIIFNFFFSFVGQIVAIPMTYNGKPIIHQKGLKEIIHARIIIILGITTIFLQI